MNNFAEDPDKIKTAINSLVDKNPNLLELKNDKGATDPLANGPTDISVHGTYIASGGGGINSPLTESGTVPRQLHTLDQVVSPNGWLIFNFAQTKQITMKDSNGAKVVFNYKHQPTNI